MKRLVLAGAAEWPDAADVDDDGALTADDIGLHRDYLTGKITEFPVN